MNDQDKSIIADAIKRASEKPYYPSHDLVRTILSYALPEPEVREVDPGIFEHSFSFTDGPHEAWIHGPDIDRQRDHRLINREWMEGHVRRASLHQSCEAIQDCLRENGIESGILQDKNGFHLEVLTEGLDARDLGKLLGASHFFGWKLAVEKDAAKRDIITFREAA